MSEPLDRVVNDFYSTLASFSQVKTNKPTIASCLLALDNLHKKTTDVSLLMTDLTGKQRSSIEILSVLIDEGASSSKRNIQNQAQKLAKVVMSSELFNSATTPIRAKILAAYRAAGGKKSTYYKQKILDLTRRLTRWKRYGREEGSTSREDLGTRIFDLFTQALERGIVENKTATDILHEMERLSSKPERDLTEEERGFLQIRGSKEFYHAFLSELKEYRKDLEEYVEHQKALLSKTFEEPDQNTLQVLQEIDVQKTYVEMDPKIKDMWRQRIELLFMSEIFSKAPSKIKTRIFSLYKAIGGPCSSDACEVFSNLTLAMTDEQIEECIQRLRGEDIRKECASLGMKARELLLSRLDRILLSKAFTNTRVPSQIGLLTLYRDIGGQWTKYIKPMVNTCIHAKTDYDATICMEEQLSKEASISQDARVTVRSPLENLVLDRDFSSAEMRGRLATIDAYRAMGGDLSIYIMKLLPMLSEVKEEEEHTECIRQVHEKEFTQACAAMDAKAKEALQHHFEEFLITHKFGNTNLRKRKDILDLCRTIGDHFYLWGFLSAPPPEGEKEEWASMVLGFLQAPEIQKALVDLLPQQKAIMQSGLLTLFGSRAFASASPQDKDTILELYASMDGSPTLYVWEKCCAQIIEREHPEDKTLKGLSRVSLQNAIEQALLGTPSIDIVLQEWENRCEKDPKLASLFPDFEKQLHLFKDRIEPLLAKEKARRPTATSVLLETYTPAPELIAQTIQGLHGSEKEYSKLVELMQERTKTSEKTTIGSWWGPQLWIVWTALTESPSIKDSNRVDQLLKLFIEKGFPNAPGYIQNAISNFFLEAAQTLDLPKNIKELIQSSFG